jgi:hypothetical protein
VVNGNGIDWLIVSGVQLYSVVIGNGIGWLTVSGVQLYSVVIGNGIDWLTVSEVQLYSVVIGNGIDWLIWIYINTGRGMGQAGNRQTLTAEVRFRHQTSPNGNW